MVKKLNNILDSGYTTLCAAILAIVVGFCFPKLGASFKPFSQIFLQLISLSVIPIIFGSVTTGVINLISGKSKDISISRILCVFVLALVIGSIVGVAVCIAFDPGKDVADSKLVSDMIFQDMRKSIPVLSIFDNFDNLQSFSFSDFLTTLLPSNPFEAFAKGNVIQILAISVLVGIAASALDGNKQTVVLEGLSVLHSSFKRVLSIPTRILPIGIFFLLASSLSEIGVDVLISMKTFCFSAAMTFLIISIVAFIIIYFYSPISVSKSLSALKEPMTVAFSTCSNQATLPFLTMALTSKFKLPEEAVELCIPFGVTICRVSNAAYFAFVTVFVVSLYNEPLSLFQYGLITFNSILASLASSGASGMVAIAMISIILDPLNLPIGSILIILVIVDPIINPVRTITSLLMNAALSCAVIKRFRGGHRNAN